MVNAFRTPPHRQRAGIIAALLVAGACSVTRFRGTPPAEDAHLIVDCLLPPRVIAEPNLGAVSLPGGALKTTALDCHTRGGDYHTADPAWALQVWTPAA